MKAKLITREGYQRLKSELDALWRVERPEVTKKVSWAASLGDRSENADYQYNKKRLREIDRRVRYLTKRIEEVQIVDYSEQQEGKIFFGAFLLKKTALRENSHTAKYVLVFFSKKRPLRENAHTAQRF